MHADAPTGRAPTRRLSPEPPDVFPAAEPGKVQEIRPLDYVVRFALGAVISVCAAILANVVGARFSGAFLAFPAILPASLTLIQEKEGTRRADRNAVGAVLGGVGLVVFAGVTEATLRDLPPIVAILIALTAWLVVSCALFASLAFLRPELCDRNQD